MRIIILSLLTFLLTDLAAQDKKTIAADKDSNAMQQIKQLEFYLTDLLEKGDLDTYAGYLADDYVRITANGKVATKTEVLESFKKQPPATSLMKPHDLDVRIYDNTAVLRLLLDLETKTGDTITKRTSIITKVFQKRNGKWYMVSLQGTSVQ